MSFAIGPGLRKQEWSRRLFEPLIQCEKAMLVDADGLNLLAKNPKHRSNWILTPHPGEAASLLGCTIAEVENNRFQAVTEVQKQFGGVTVLKGRGTLICDGRPNLPCPRRQSRVGNRRQWRSVVRNHRRVSCSGIIADSCRLLWCLHTRRSSRSRRRKWATRNAGV